MFRMRTFALGVLFAGLTLSAAPQIMASPLIPVPTVIPPVPDSIRMTAVERAVLRARLEMVEITSASTDEQHAIYAEGTHALDYLPLTMDVHQRAVRIAKKASKAIKANVKESRKALKSALKDARVRVLSAGGSASDLDVLDQLYSDSWQTVQATGMELSLILRARADRTYP